MPVLASTSYQPPRWQFSGHLQTIIPSVFRRVEDVAYRRERIATPDGDFLDLDWSLAGSDKLVVISHGLEGSADRHYVRGMAKAFNAVGWDALAWNCRSCSGEMNRLARFYHHGDSLDLETVVRHAASTGGYEEIALVGFSMGGSMTLRLLGEKGSDVLPVIRKAVAISVPCDLVTSVVHLSKPGNRFYARRFIRKLGRKIKAKADLFPEQISYRHFDKVKAFKDFDDRYTAPLHGFRDAEDFYRQASVKPYLPHVRVPSLIINAQNDPFLTPDCFPVAEAEANPYLFLEMPVQGGHVGFSAPDGTNWAETRTLAFVLSQNEKG
ncbi:MAG TPA: alpha/beta fold hydrolase [Cytophagales bacterium]